MGIMFSSLLDGDVEWYPMIGALGAGLDESRVILSSNPSYHWNDGGLIADSPVDFEATFEGGMWMMAKTIDVPAFNRNPLRCEPNFTVPRHHHNLDEMIIVFAGEFHIAHEDGDEAKVEVVRPGQVFISRAGTPYEMTAGAEGVTYIETWPEPVLNLHTYWHDSPAWVRR